MVRDTFSARKTSGRFSTDLEIHEGDGILGKGEAIQADFNGSRRRIPVEMNRQCEGTEGETPRVYLEDVPLVIERMRVSTETVNILDPRNLHIEP